MKLVRGRRRRLQLEKEDDLLNTESPPRFSPL